jgi:hypothetical protein
LQCALPDFGKAAIERWFLRQPRHDVRLIMNR